jgi:hypothetical protein
MERKKKENNPTILSQQSVSWRCSKLSYGPGIKKINIRPFKLGKKCEVGAKGALGVPIVKSAFSYGSHAR